MSRQGFLDSVARQVELAGDLAGRPWPPPDRPWSQAQTRTDVLFAHWQVPLDELARLIPPELTVDTFEGAAWVGAVSSRLEHLRVRGLVPVPGLSSGLLLEFVAYVTHEDRPGIWPLAVEASNPLLVEAAKRAQRLPAYRARIELAAAARGGLAYRAARDGLSFAVEFAGAGGGFTAGPGTFGQFFAERYAVYTSDGGRLYRSELHHAPWTLEAACGAVGSATLAPLVLDGAPQLAFSAIQDLLVWSPEEL